MRRCGWGERKHLCAVLLEPCKEIRIADDTVFDDLAESRCNLSRRQCLEQIEIHKDCIWLVECTDEILAERMVDGNLAADARVHLCEQARRQLDKGHAAHIGRRDKASEVADHASAECKDRRSTI